MLVGTLAQVERAVDVAAIFGFPVLDEHPSISTFERNTVLEWLDGTELTTGVSVRVPANFALCPYVNGESAVIVAGSTNGAAAGASRSDARAQALREIVERDAFWFYARTGADPLLIDVTTLPDGIVEIMREFDGEFAVAALPNPFEAPVANVTFRSGSAFQAKCARGSGHAATLVDAIRRAFAECIQMLYSLDSGIDVEASPTDMRSLWFNGTALQAMPNFFHSAARPASLEKARNVFTENQSTGQLLESAAEQGQTVLEIPLVGEPGFSVVKVLMSGASVSDATYFAACERLAEFSELVGHSSPDVKYHGSLFM